MQTGWVNLGAKDGKWKSSSPHLAESLCGFIGVMRVFFLFKLDMLKQNNLKNEEELNKSKELLNLENKKVEELKKEL